MFPTRSAREGEQGTRWSLTAALGALLLLYYLVPLASLLRQPPGAIAAGLRDPEVVSAAATSLTTALTSTAISTLLGVPLAYWLARSEFTGKSVVTGLVAFPIVLPPVVSGMVLISVFGPNTLVGSAAADAGLPLTRSFVGVVLAQTFVASPFVVVTAKSAFENVDERLEDAARTLGRDRFSTFRSVTLPLAMPGVAAGMTLVFARALGEFGATAMTAYYPRTMPVQIWVTFVSRGLDAAFPVAVILLAISLVALSLLALLGRGPAR